MIWFVMAPAVPAAVAGGQVTASLPFGGYYHPGRFVPVRVSAPTGSSEVRIWAPGSVSTTIENARGEIVAPFLPVADSLTAVQISGAAPVGLKALGEHQRLVATAGAEVDLAKDLFPGEQILPVELDLARPLLDPPLAWTGLDAVVLSAPARARLTDRQISVLLAGGVVIVAEGDQAPRWPWQPLRNAWALRHDVVGPREPVRAEAYAPTRAWDRGVPAAWRGQIVLVAALFAILAVGLALWPWRYSTGVFLVLCVLTVVFVVLAYLRRPPELTMRKGVVVEDPRFTQTEVWVWHACLRESRLGRAAVEFTVPVFASARQVDQCDPRLICDGRGRPVSYDFRLGVDQSLAFVTRSVSASPNPPAFPTLNLPPPDSVWRDFAGELYLRPGDRLVGEEGGVTLIARGARE
jgi:hypothetical protein